MTISVGQKFPNATLMRRTADKNLEHIELDPFFAGRKVVIVGMPGAFTGTCSSTHLPGLIEAGQRLKENGIDEIVVFAVNDPAVMEAWSKDTGADVGGITLLADPSCELTEALGLRFDAPQAGLIARCIRFAAVVSDGTVEILKFEEKPVGCSLTSGSSILDDLMAKG